ncbi:hypothetical protein PIB30_064455 [Stylosanthes scabra]|uniref:Uncharacterized protein n=1 Tax=Stylosanthes scabra TaxID=79078 RepID=A0ABU6UMD4_9FABA|nr:hypothetical protein [Stylosanthes scabra]
MSLSKRKSTPLPDSSHDSQLTTHPDDHTPSPPPPFNLPVLASKHPPKSSALSTAEAAVSSPPRTVPARLQLRRPSLKLRRPSLMLAALLLRFRRPSSKYQRRRCVFPPISTSSNSC